MSVRRTLFLLIIITLIIPFFSFGNQVNPAAATQQAADLDSIQLYRVDRGTVALTVSAIGTIQPAEVAELSFLLPGRVNRVVVQRDDYVLAGDVLLQLDNTTQQLAYEQALLGLDRAKLQMDDLMVIDEDTIRVAEAAVDAAWGTYLSLSNSITDGDREAAQLAYEQALVAVRNARMERDRIGGRFGGDSTEWQIAHAQYGEAQFQAEIARLQAAGLEDQLRPQLNAAYARVVQAQRDLERAQAGPQEAEIEAAEIAIRQAESQVDRAELALSRTTLTAPFDGYISTLNAEVGSLVAPGVTVLEITDVSPLTLTVQVDEVDIGLVEVDLPVRVELDALPGVNFPAAVARVASVGTNEGGIVNYDVELSFVAEDPRVRVGMTAEAVVVIDERQDVLRVPNLYIRRDRATGAAFVTVLTEDDLLQEVPVELGLVGQETSEIVSGLQPGDLIAIDLGGTGITSFFGG